MDIMVVSVQPTAGIIPPVANASGFERRSGSATRLHAHASESGLDANTVYSTPCSGETAVRRPRGVSGTQVSRFPSAYQLFHQRDGHDPNGHSSLPASTSVSLTTLAMEADPYYPNRRAL